MTTGRDVAVCVKVVQKSCLDVYGAWPGPGTPETDCRFKDCVDDYNCVIGEVAVLYWVRAAGDWNQKVDTNVQPLPGEPGELRKDSVVSCYCTYTDVCDYDCVIDPIGGTKRCKSMNRTDTAITKLITVVGTCVGGIEET